jgi:hypothetical protein
MRYADIRMPGIKIWAGLFMMFLGTTAEAGIVRVESFKDLGIVKNLGVHSYFNSTPFVDNLMIRDLSGVDRVVSGRWHMGFVSLGYLIGYVDNIYYSIPGQEGYLSGGYNSSLGDGNRPTGVFLVYDSTGNGWDFVDGVVGSLRDLADGDRFFTEKDILFGSAGLRGDLGIGLLPAYSAIGEVGILPHMVVNPIPEPTIALLSPSNNSTGITPSLTLEWYINGDYTYAVYLGEDPNNLALFSEVAVETLTLDANDIDCESTYYWMVAANDGTETIESEIYRFTTADCVCQEAFVGDVNNDCRVDILDLCILSENWLKESNRVWASQ